MENALAGGLNSQVDYEPAGRRDNRPTVVVTSALGPSLHAWRLTPDEADAWAVTLQEQAAEARSGIVRAGPLLNGGKL